MKKMFLGLACVAALGACADGRGQVVDPRYRFSSDAPYDQYRAAREMALTGKAAVPQTVPRAHPYNAPTPEQIASPTAVQRMTGTATTTAVAAGTVPASGKGGYYDPATGKRLASAPAARPVAPPPAPAPAPQAQAVETDALARYAQLQRHAPGTAVFVRAGGSAADAARACARAPNPDSAQLMFLSSGGPEQDPLGMDPDGDGFVCGWTPAAYRSNQL